MLNVGSLIVDPVLDPARYKGQRGIPQTLWPTFYLPLT